MNYFSQTDMAEVTRLTREGKLAEAMSLLRRGQADRSPPHPQTDPLMLTLAHPSTHQGEAESWHRIGRSLRQSSPSDQFSVYPARNRTDPGIVPGRMPAPLPSGAHFEEFDFSNHAGTRRYKFYRPSGYAGQALPLVVMLHGCKQTPDDFAAGTRMNHLAEEQTFFVAYPAQPQSANMSKCWNWYSPADQKRGRGEPSLIAGITRRIMSDFSVDPARIYIAGLSAGGAAAAIMGAAYPELYAAIGVHSGLACGAARDMPSAFAAMRQGSDAAGMTLAGRAIVPTIVFHGDRDLTVNPVNGDQVIAQSKSAGDLHMTISQGVSPGGIRYTRTVQCGSSGAPLLEQWTLHGAGHAWAGGSPAGSFTDPRGPDASREMMRFFLQQPVKG